MSINIKLQDFTATIHKTSQQNGGLFDLIHVESLIETDQPMTIQDIWYIPNKKPINPIYKALFEQNQITLTPKHCSVMNAEIQEASDALAVAQSGDQDATIKHLSILAEISCMSQTTLSAVEGTTNTYLLSYDYKLFPIATNTFELKVILPFGGLIMPDNRDEIQITVVTPIGAKIDTTNTKGVDISGNILTPEYAQFSRTRKQVVAFQYATDPTFTIRYNY